MLGKLSASYYIQGKMHDPSFGGVGGGGGGGENESIFMREKKEYAVVMTDSFKFISFELQMILFTLCLF